MAQETSEKGPPLCSDGHEKQEVENDPLDSAVNHPRYPRYTGVGGPGLSNAT